MTGRVVVVAARPGPLGAAVAAALSEAGAAVSVVTPPFADPAAAAAALAAAGEPDVVVWADVDPDALHPDPLVGLGEPDWERRCEEPLSSALWLLQAAHRHLRGRDGRVVVVCPSVALEGAAGLVPLATAAEGQRLLAKAAARRWGADGITVNVVTVPVAALGPDVAGEAPDAVRTEVALAGVDPLASAAAAVVWLAGPGSAGITGATIGADGGAVMAP
jgi:NAD(P)-dependent dehydrogenase (short-subunit alcohol dehydrogenase family)